MPISHPQHLSHCILSLALLCAIGCSDAPDASEASSSMTQRDASMADVLDDTASTMNGDADVVEETSPDLPPDPQGDDTGGEDRISVPARPWPVTEPGHYNVGYREFEVTYDADPGTGASPRTLRVAVWYPTLAAAGTPVSYLDILERPEVFREASVGVDSPAPLLVFSHGATNFAEVSFYQAEFFAQHGWIVAAPDHTTDTLFDFGQPRQDETYAWRPLDISATLDFLQAGLAPDDPLAGLVGTDVVMSGFSFGGYTSLALAGAQYQLDLLDAQCDSISRTFCAFLQQGGRDRLGAGFLDTRLKAIVPIAAGNADMIAAGGAAIDIPVLLFTGSLDASNSNEDDGDPFWAGLDGARDVRINLPNAAHGSFSNTCDFIPDPSGTQCGPDFIEPATAFRLINAYSLAFARLHALDDVSDVDLASGARNLDQAELEIFQKAP